VVRRQTPSTRSRPLCTFGTGRLDILGHGKHLPETHWVVCGKPGFTSADPGEPFVRRQNSGHANGDLNPRGYTGIQGDNSNFRRHLQVCPGRQACGAQGGYRSVPASAWDHVWARGMCSRMWLPGRATDALYVMHSYGLLHFMQFITGPWFEWSQANL
jgi:hypothetical protein